MEFYTDTVLGNTQSLTPEGFLLCRNVVLARTGSQVYFAGEVPLDADADGMVLIERDADEVFSPESIASFQGKPITNDHPIVAVTPDNWKHYSVGHVLNVHRGDGANSDVLIGDLVVTDRDAIALVRNGKRALSVGYDAEYEQISRGRGRQKNIVANHVALVDEGRCGDRCMIGDSKPRRSAMSRTKPHVTWTWDQSANGDQTGGGKQPGGSVGPRIIARLRGDVTQYTVGTDGAGDPVLWCHADTGGILDPGETNTGSGMKRTNFDWNAAVRRQRQIRAHDAERATVSATTMRAMSEANRRAWTR